MAKKNIIIAITVTCSLFVLGGVQILYAADNGASTTVDTISGTTKAQSEKSRSNSDTQSLQLTAANPVDFSSTDSTTQTNSMATDDANVDTATTNTVSQSSKSNDSLTLQPANTVSSGSIDLDPGHVFATPVRTSSKHFKMWPSNLCR